MTGQDIHDFIIAGGVDTAPSSVTDEAGFDSNNVVNNNVDVKRGREDRAVGRQVGGQLGWREVGGKIRRPYQWQGNGMLPLTEYARSPLTTHSRLRCFPDCGGLHNRLGQPHQARLHGEGSVRGGRVQLRVEVLYDSAFGLPLLYFRMIYIGGSSGVVRAETANPYWSPALVPPAPASLRCNAWCSSCARWQRRHTTGTT